MGWISFTVGEPPTQATIKFFSIAEEFDKIKEAFLGFMSSVTPGFMTLIILCSIMGIVVLFVYSVYIAVRDFRFDFEEERANEGS